MWEERETPTVKKRGYGGEAKGKSTKIQLEMVEKKPV